MRQAICYIYTGYAQFQNMLWTVLSDKCCEDNSHLTPHQHAAKHHLQPVKEVLPNDDDHGPAGGPALTGTDGFDTRGSWIREQSINSLRGCTRIENKTR